MEAVSTPSEAPQGRGQGRRGVLEHLEGYKRYPERFLSPNQKAPSSPLPLPSGSARPPLGPCGLPGAQPSPRESQAWDLLSLLIKKTKLLPLGKRLLKAALRQGAWLGARSAEAWVSLAARASPSQRACKGCRLLWGGGKEAVARWQSHVTTAQVPRARPPEQTKLRPLAHPPLFSVVRKKQKTPPPPPLLPWETSEALFHCAP